MDKIHWCKYIENVVFSTSTMYCVAHMLHNVCLKIVDVINVEIVLIVRDRKNTVIIVSIVNGLHSLYATGVALIALSCTFVTRV